MLSVPIKKKSMRCVLVLMISITTFFIYFQYLKKRADIIPVHMNQNINKLDLSRGELRYSEESDATVTSRDYLVKTKSCNIPDLDPYGPTVNMFIKVKKYHKCPHWNLITYKRGFKIIVNATEVRKNYPHFSKCSYRPYTKNQGTDEEMYFIENSFQNFTQSIKASDEFCMVLCFDTKDKELSKQHFAFVLRNETLIKLRNNMRFLNNELKPKTNRPMNVVLIGLESTSRLNFIRHMNFTESYLRNDLDAVELLGYNKAEMNTFLNVVMMLLGITWEEMNDPLEFYDEYPFIWKDFMRSGYVTLIGQDLFHGSAFHFRSKGFKWKPFDYYMRPFIFGLETTNYRDNLCSGNDLVFQILLDQLTEFVTVYNDVPRFTFTFISNPSHDDPNGLGIVDLPLRNTLANLNKQGSLDDTVLLIFGDHGSRFGGIRNTFQGHLEENLPVFYISLPKWFRKEQGHLYNNLKRNTEKLTSNVDVYATLVDILELGRGHKSPLVSGKYGTSIFRDISTNRTCDDIKIKDLYCACASFVETNPTESAIVHNISKWVVDEINSILLSVSRLCIELRLGKIHKTWKSANSEALKDGEEKAEHSRVIDFIIQFNVSPSFAEFEATVRYFAGENKFMILGNILRTNAFKGQSDCVARRKNGMVLERFCFCREQLITQ